MLFADADGFWKPPNVYDALGVAGFAVGLGSVWLSWYLARRDIRKRLAEAADQAAAAARAEVRRVARAMAHVGVADTVRSFEMAREAYGGKRWERVIDLCQLGQAQLARTLAQPAAATAAPELVPIPGVVQRCIQAIRERPTGRTGSPADHALQLLEQSLSALQSAEGRFMAIQPEAGDE